MSNVPDLIFKAAEAVASADAHADTYVSALRATGDINGGPDHRIAWIFSQAFDARMGNGNRFGGNLYENGQNGISMISAFAVLAERTPLITFGYACANEIMCDAIGSSDSLDIIDIGIGKGSQWRSLFKQMSSRHLRPPSVRLTGIDLPAGGEDPLQQLRAVGSDLVRDANEFGIPFKYRPIARDIEDVNFSSHQSKSQRPLAINAAFSLHHIRDTSNVLGAVRPRDAVLRRIRGLQPTIFTLIEPDANHNTLPFVERVMEAYRHYSIVFDIFEESLPRVSPARCLLESQFFGHEIFNVVASEGVDRVERHDQLDTWRKRLKAHGFLPQRLDEHASRVQEKLLLRAPFSIDANQGALCLSWKGKRLLTTSAWRTEPR
jgi:hypothetical protein